jgi:lysophospholipase L1-like esterase
MKPMLIVILIISVIGNAVGLFAAYKAFRYREALNQFQVYNKNLVSNYEALKSDFPGASVYTDDNHRLLSELSADDRKKMTVMFGASITKGFDPGKYLPGKKIINRGVGSQSNTQLLTRFSSDVLQLAPGQVVLKFCSGNFTPQLDSCMMWDEFETMALTAQRKGIKPLLATILPATKGAEHYVNYKMADNIKLFNDKIRNLASAHNFPVVDYYKALANSDGFLPDSLARDEIHPNEKGYEIMASVLSPLVN